MRWLKDRDASVRSFGPGGNFSDDPKFRCCGCCHVRTGTILLGIYNLVTEIMAISVLLFAILHPDMFFTVDSSTNQMSASSGSRIKQPWLSVANNSQVTEGGVLEPALPELPTPLPQRGDTNDVVKIEMRPSRNYLSKSDLMLITQRRVESGDVHLAVALIFGLMVITIMMIYGVMKGRPVYLLPFFCFQVFDFILACLTALGHYTWLPNVQDTIRSSNFYGDDLVSIDSQWVAICVMLIYVIVLACKAYFIGVVWSCYQYLQARNQMIIVYSHDRDVESLLLPPDYETARKMPPPADQFPASPPNDYTQPPPAYGSQ